MEPPARRIECRSDSELQDQKKLDHICRAVAAWKVPSDPEMAMLVQGAKAAFDVRSPVFCGLEVLYVRNGGVRMLTDMLFQTYNSQLT